MTRAITLLLTVWLTACSTVPVPRPDVPPASETVFSHDAWDDFVSRYVDRDGRVDYTAARNGRGDLDRYLATLAKTSPDSDASAFPTEAHRLAYWINAYNAWTIATVLDHYPIDSVRSVRAPSVLFFAPEGTGFFLLQRITLGGRRTSLYALENRVIRKRFDDPRIHFALNCASIGCPRLPQEAFTGIELEKQLSREARDFVADPRHVVVDTAEREIQISSIFDWYAGDFTGWLKRNVPGQPPTLERYVALFAGERLREQLAACADCQVAFIPYDWGLNAQSTSP